MIATKGSGTSPRMWVVPSRSDYMGEWSASGIRRDFLPISTQSFCFTGEQTKAQRAGTPQGHRACHEQTRDSGVSGLFSLHRFFIAIVVHLKQCKIPSFPTWSNGKEREVLAQNLLKAPKLKYPNPGRPSLHLAAHICNTAHLHQQRSIHTLQVWNLGLQV